MSYHRERYSRDGNKQIMAAGGVLDAHIDEGGAWTIFENTFSDYMEDFQQMDRDQVLPTIINNVAAKERPVVIDLYARTGTLRDFNQTRLGGRPMKGLAVGLKDYRTSEAKTQDDKLGINYLPTDLAQINNWDAISQWLGKDKAHLVMERGYGAVALYTPTRLQFYHRAMSRIWDMLDPSGGVALLQLPPESALDDKDILLHPWLDQLDQAGIYYQYLPTYSSKDNSRPYGLFMLEKNPEVEVLPTLDLHAYRKSKYPLRRRPTSRPTRRESLKRLLQVKSSSIFGRSNAEGL